METNMSASFLRVILIVSAACGAILSSPASAQLQIAAGELKCGVKGGVSFIIGSTRELRCVFRVNPNDEGERYEGQIEKYGLDIGVTDNAILTWIVLASARGIETGALAGRYVGLAADATVGVGGGANVLIGGSNNAISLQPLSVQGQTGLNAALAVAAVELRPFYEGK
jgi:hypothetical protein